ncbi:MAG: hypothetical protein RSA49_00140 [Anaerovoracaceae bacterium]
MNDRRDKLENKGFKALAIAIVNSAVDDYKKAIRGKKAEPRSTPGQTKSECEGFFKSDWFMMLSDMDGPRIISKLNADYQKELKRKGEHE